MEENLLLLKHSLENKNYKYMTSVSKNAYIAVQRYIYVRCKIKHIY